EGACHGCARCESGPAVAPRQWPDTSKLLRLPGSGPRLGGRETNEIVSIAFMSSSSVVVIMGRAFSFAGRETHVQNIQEKPGIRAPSSSIPKKAKAVQRFTCRAA